MLFEVGYFERNKKALESLLMKVQETKTHETQSFEEGMQQMEDIVDLLKGCEQFDFSLWIAEEFVGVVLSGNIEGEVKASIDNMNFRLQLL